MSRRSAAAQWPFYRAMFKSYTNPTCVVAGPNRQNTWLYVHGTTPTVLRLHPPVIRFLLDTLTELAELPDRAPFEPVPVYRSLRRDATLSHPHCVIAGRNRGDAWLHIHAAAPSAVQLTPSVITFLLDTLTELPAATHRSASTSPKPLELVPPLATSGVTGSN